MIFHIDTQPVNSRTDWQHQLKPAAVQRREFSPPGIAQRMVTTAPVLPPDIIVMGYLEASGASTAEAVSLLQDQILTWSALKGDATPHTVRLHNREYLNCEVVEAATTGPVTASNSGVRVGFMFAFRMPVLAVQEALVDEEEEE